MVSSSAAIQTVKHRLKFINRSRCVSKFACRSFSYQFELTAFEWRETARLPVSCSVAPPGAVHGLREAAGELRLAEEPHDAAYWRETARLSALWEVLQSER